ncbi:hypothetical protein BT96DRAFT_1008570 [Gymnopus androsaceus JB14]|uniref:Uncharacterized protein n=1 Tax=Gymnopus androsaceus JB14 TaxID=1447944 RepID=A0A6A4GEU8_9AGAR|nr:hypothetical protein BT96DRAFT_1008570 [Gymnopus androsaceus JB14]
MASSFHIDNSSHMSPQTRHPATFTFNNSKSHLPPRSFSPTIGEAGSGGCCLDCGECPLDPPTLYTDLPLPLHDPADPDEFDDTDGVCTETTDVDESQHRHLISHFGQEGWEDREVELRLLLLLDNEEEVSSLYPRSSSTSSSNRSRSSSFGLPPPLGIAIGFSVTRQTNTRSRSWTDPGTGPPKYLSYVPNAPTTPQPPSQSSKSCQTSHIPRFRGAGSETKLTPAEGKERRKLTVANTEVVASSSSSSEAKIRRRGLLVVKSEGRLKVKFGAEQDRENYHYDHYLVVQEEMNNYSSGPGTGRHFSVASYPSAESIYTDDHAEKAEESELDISHSRNGQSLLSDAQDLENRSLGLSPLDETHSCRKAALLGLVRGLGDEHSGQSSPSNTNRNRSASGLSILSEGESDYSGAKRLAVESEYEFHVNGGGAASGVD